MPPSPQTLTEIATTFLTLCAQGDVQAAYDRFVAPDFVHHNAHFPQGRQALLDAMAQSAAAEPNKSFEVRQVIAAGDRVAVHSHLARRDAQTQYAVVHILRFEGEQIAELWDVAQEIPTDSPNALGAF